MKFFTSEMIESMVSVLHEICSMDAEVTDENGVIISSPSPRRNGETLDHIRQLFASGQTESLIPDPDASIPGQGWLSFAVQYKDIVLGAFSIYGDLEKLSSCSSTLQNVAQLLVEANFTYTRSQFKSNAIVMFVNEWLHLNSDSDYDEFKDYAQIMAVDLTVPRTVVDLHIHNLQQISAASVEKGYVSKVPEMIQQQIIELIDKEKNDFCISSGNDFILLITGDDIGETKRLIERVKRSIERNFDVSVIAGFSPIVYDYKEISKNYRYAQLATRVARTRNRSFAFYSDLSIELLLSSLSPGIKQEYIHKIFKGASLAEIKEWINILFVYFKCDGSLNHTAQQLYLHKNTLQYKLRKIWEQTGFDPRNRSDSVALYLAMYIFLERDPGAS